MGDYDFEEVRTSFEEYFNLERELKQDPNGERNQFLERHRRFASIGAYLRGLELTSDDILEIFSGYNQEKIRGIGELKRRLEEEQRRRERLERRYDALESKVIDAFANAGPLLRHIGIEKIDPLPDLKETDKPKQD